MTQFNEIFVSASVREKSNVKSMDKLLNEAKANVKAGRTEGTLMDNVRFVLRNLTIILL